MSERNATSSESIRVGDLVQVVVPGCCDISLGLTFIVERLEKKALQHRCMFCEQYHGSGKFAYSAQHDAYCAVSRLKRIPPAGELGIVDEKENLREPA